MSSPDSQVFLRELDKKLWIDSVHVAGGCIAAGRLRSNLEWQDADSRWKYGIPPHGNDNFACIQHLLHNLAPIPAAWCDVRRCATEAELVECIAAAPETCLAMAACTS